MTQAAAGGRNFFPAGRLTVPWLGTVHGDRLGLSGPKSSVDGLHGCGQSHQAAGGLVPGSAPPTGPPGPSLWRTCVHTRPCPAQPRGRAAAPRWRGPWPPGLPPGSSTVTAPWNTDEPLSLPHATPFRLSALSKRRDRETRRHLRAHAGREIDYERDVSSRFVQNRRAAGTVLGKGDPTRRPLEQRAELSPCPGASPRLTAHSTPSSSAGRGSFTRGPPPSPAGRVLLCPRGLPLGVPWPPRPGRPPGAVSLRPVWFSAPATWGPAAFRVPGCLLWIASSPPAPNRTRVCTEAPAPRACGPRCPLASAAPRASAPVCVRVRVLRARLLRPGLTSHPPVPFPDVSAPSAGPQKRTVLDWEGPLP